MKLRLLDYEKKEHFCNVPNNTKEITIEIISGDMVLTSPIHFDTSTTRDTDFLDGSVTLKREQFSILDTIKDPYDLFGIVILEDLKNDH